VLTIGTLNVFSSFSTNVTLVPSKHVFHLQLSGGKLMMSEFDESFMGACDFLTEMTEEKTECINAFIKCRNVVDWLQESMKKSMCIYVYFNTLTVLCRIFQLKYAVTPK